MTQLQLPDIACPLCGEPIHEETTRLTTQNCGRQVFRRLSYTCTECGATVTAQRTSHLTLVEGGDG